jgi:hypothetical protein
MTFPPDRLLRPIGGRGEGRFGHLSVGQLEFGFWDFIRGDTK